MNATAKQYLFVGGMGVLAYMLFFRKKPAAAAAAGVVTPSPFTGINVSQHPFVANPDYLAGGAPPPLVPPPDLGSETNDLDLIRNAYHPVGEGPSMDPNDPRYPSSTSALSPIEESESRLV